MSELSLSEKVIDILNSKGVNAIVLMRNHVGSLDEVVVHTEEDLLSVFRNLKNIEDSVIRFAPVQTAAHVNTLALPAYRYEYEDSYYMSNFKIETVGEGD
jgi:hypothetical protein